MEGRVQSFDELHGTHGRHRILLLDCGTGSEVHKYEYMMQLRRCESGPNGLLYLSKCLWSVCGDLEFKCNAV